jgi:hypothetical protein
MTKKTEMIIYRPATVERRFDDKPGFYWVSISKIGVRQIVLAAGEAPLKLGQEIYVWWLPKGNCWIKS